MRGGKIELAYPWAEPFDPGSHALRYKDPDSKPVEPKRDRRRAPFGRVFERRSPL